MLPNTAGLYVVKAAESVLALQQLGSRSAAAAPRAVPDDGRTPGTLRGGAGVVDRATAEAGLAAFPKAAGLRPFASVDAPSC